METQSERNPALHICVNREKKASCGDYVFDSFDVVSISYINKQQLQEDKVLLTSIPTGHSVNPVDSIRTGLCQTRVVNYLPLRF